MTKIAFSTDMLPPDLDPARKARHWADAISSAGQFDVDCPRPDRFSARIEMQALGNVQVSSAFATSIRLTRTKRHTQAESRNDVLLLISNGTRPLGGRQGGAEVVLRRGDAMIVDNSQPHCTYALTGGHALALTLPKSPGLEVAFGDPRDMTIDRSSEALRLLRGYLRLLISGNVPGDQGLAAAAAEHVTELSALAVAARRSVRFPAEAMGVAAARASLIIEAIVRNAGNPALDADMVGRMVGLSGRSVQHILQQAATTFTGELRQARLAVATRMLTAGAFDHLSIMDIALASGFVDVSTFYRSFRKAGGPSPSEIRSRRGEGHR